MQMQLDECGVTTSNLTTLQLSNQVAWMKKDESSNWFVNYFCPSVQWYYTKHSSEHKVPIICETSIHHTLLLRFYFTHQEQSFLQPLDLA